MATWDGELLEKIFFLFLPKKIRMAIWDRKLLEMLYNHTYKYNSNKRRSGRQPRESYAGAMGLNGPDFFLV